uniref:Putative secreted protein n=1 Tax=Ixodes ricinus TaxID=34613 RepID=V5GZG0_IXORI
MQLAYFMVIVTFMHLSCEVQSESIPDIRGKMKNLPEDCKEKLIKQMQNFCNGNPFQTQSCRVKAFRVQIYMWRRSQQRKDKGNICPRFYTERWDPLRAR